MKKRKRNGSGKKKSGVSVEAEAPSSASASEIETRRTAPSRPKKVKKVFVKQSLLDSEVMEYEEHSDHSQREFLRRIGAKVCKDADVTSRPHPKKMKIKKMKIRSGRVTDTGIYIPSRFARIRNHKTDPRRHSQMMKYASLAIDEYNLKEHTKYRVVDVLEAAYQPVSGIIYLVGFEARADGESATFEGQVIQCRVSKRLKSISVMAVRMRKPGRPDSEWHEGTLQELVYP